MKTLTESVDAAAVPVHRRHRPRREGARTIEKAPPGYLDAVADALRGVEPWEARRRSRTTLDAVGTGDGLAQPEARRSQPVRAAVTGSKVSPPLPESLELLGRERDDRPPPRRRLRTRNASVAVSLRSFGVVNGSPVRLICSGARPDYDARVRLLRGRDFRLLVLSNGLSAFGDELALVALTIKVADLTGSGLAVAGLLLVGIVPMVVFSPFAGALVDRTETTGTLAIASLLQAAIALGLAFSQRALADPDPVVPAGDGRVGRVARGLRPRCRRRSTSTTSRPPTPGWRPLATSAWWPGRSRWRPWPVRSATTPPVPLVV